MKTNIISVIKFNICVFTLFSMQVLAQGAVILTQAPDAGDTSSFRAQITAAEKNCKNLRCSDSPVRAKTLSKVQLENFDQKLLAEMTETCQDIAETEWPETILEGPYVASFKVKISRLEAVVNAQGLMGYRATYIDQAWKTENCEYNPERPNTVNDCEPGIFVESAFISAKTGESFRDPNSVVDFVPKKN